MCFRKIIVSSTFFITLTLITQGCSNLQEKEYTSIPENVYKQAEKVCNNIDGTHFIVRDRLVWLKKKDKSEIELNHYKSILPDGYYFCSGHDRNSQIID